MNAPADLGSVPKGFIRLDEQDRGGRYGAIYYDHPLTPEEIKVYANHYLPDDICIREVAVVSERFHARLNAKGKVYQYTCYIGDEKPVFDRMYTWVLPEWVTNGTPDRMPDIEAMQKAAGYLIGTHDFKSFCGNNKMKKSTVRTIYDITIAEEEGYLRMTFHGNGFLQNMVRILTGDAVRGWLWTQKGRRYGSDTCCL